MVSNIVHLNLVKLALTSSSANAILISCNAYLSLDISQVVVHALLISIADIQIQIERC